MRASRFAVGFLSHIPIRAILAISLLAFLAASSSFAQDEMPTRVTDQNRSGDLPFSATVGTDLEHVVIAGGNLTVNIPFANVPGRGMPFSFGLWYDARFLVVGLRSMPSNHEIWNVEQRFYITPKGLWSVTQPGLSFNSYSHDCSTQRGVSNQLSGTVTGQSNYIYHDASGGKHPLDVGFENGVCTIHGNPWSFSSPGPDTSGDGLQSDTNSVTLADGTVLGSGGVAGSAVTTPDVIPYGFFFGENTNILQGQAAILDPNGNSLAQYPGGLGYHGPLADHAAEREQQHSIHHP